MTRTLVLLLLAVTVIRSAPDRKAAAVQAKQRELELLRTYVGTARDSLQNEIAARWRARQRSVEQRESNKEESERLRESQERAYAELSRAKEELFAAQRRLEDERTDQNRTAEEWNLVGTAVGELFQKEADAVLEQFPLDRERRRRDLEQARRSVA